MQNPFSFPDFTRVKVNRLTPKEGETKEITVNLEVAFNSGDSAKDLWLEWGDVVELPEQDHPLNEYWSGLPQQVVETLEKCLRRKVEILVKGQTNAIMLTSPHLSNNPSRAVPTRSVRGMPVPGSISNPPGIVAIVGQDLESQKEISYFRLYDVVLNANVLRASSDVTRVKVRRSDPETKQQRELVFNLEKSDPRNDLWLRDGDVIEIPEK